MAVQMQLKREGKEGRGSKRENEGRILSSVECMVLFSIIIQNNDQF